MPLITEMPRGLVLSETQGSKVVSNNDKTIRR